jgi:multiple sugar transport system permease protein
MKRGGLVIGCNWGGALRYLLLTLFVVIWLFPVFLPVSVSLRNAKELFTYPPTIIPSKIELTHYVTAWIEADFARYFGNTMIYTLGSVIPMLFFSALSGYAFARLQFPGRDLLFIAVLATLMVPGQVVLVPLFLIVRNLGLYNTYLGLILPRVFSAFSVFFLRQNFIGLPKDLEDAARIDGAGEFRIFARIMLPLCKPALIALSIFQFNSIWKDLLWPLVIAPGKEHRVMQVGLAIYMDEQKYVDQWNELMAASLIAVFPVLVLFLFLQRYFTQTIAMTGLKE